ncbi:unnamed protein product [Linum tenue]|uniref:Uncharacterized protein n=1 Tax=Linum tenue TaxID=586396 RepID=A0AAV0KWZ7_9ROSI|nr:unnamed protein product [Linum tenue]
MVALPPPLRRRFFCTQAAKASRNHLSWTVKQVKKSNFTADIVEEIKTQVSASDFVAVSLQKTGSFSAPWHRPSPFDTPDIAYLKAKYAADRFQVLQLAICPFSIRVPTVTAYPYNFHLFPRDEMKTGMPSYSFSCQSSSLVAMAHDGFDFNACINDGISYLSREQESVVKTRSERPRPVSDLGETASPLSVADSIFVERVKSRVKHWKNACQDSGSNTKGDESLVKALRRLIVTTEQFESRPCMNIDVCSDRQAHLVVKMLQKFDENLVPLMVPAKGGGTQAVRVVSTTSKEDRDLLLRKLQNDEDEANKNIRGFREVIDLISASQKPIVSHNSLNDLTFIHSKFLGPLPPSMKEFMESLHHVFLHVIDVNHLVQEIGLPKRVTSIPYTISNLNHRYHAPIDVEIPLQGAAVEEESHGHNVVSISELFAKLCCILKLTPGVGEVHAEKGTSPLQVYANTFNPLVSGPQEEPTVREEIRVWTSSNTKKVRRDDLVFLWGFRCGTTAGNLKCLLEGSHEVFLDEFHVRLVDKSCAIVVFWRPGSSGTFLNAMTHNLSDASSSSLRELVSEGVRASGYETYDRACRSGFWEPSLADSLDKAAAAAMADMEVSSESDHRTELLDSYRKSELMIDLDEL